ncbi:MAG: YlcI/YnfO family protein [Mariprofundaceae bacterium]|nr:YlcI/YnfO family protein [Mariprofundaceae bacterium]
MEHCICNAEAPFIKTATIPPLRITPDLRHDAESVLREGETLSSFVEESLRKRVEHRKFQQEFIARGLAARDKARDTGRYVSKEEVMGALRSTLGKAQSGQ